MNEGLFSLFINNKQISKIYNNGKQISKIYHNGKKIKRIEIPSGPKIYGIKRKE